MLHLYVDSSDPQKWFEQGSLFILQRQLSRTLLKDEIRLLLPARFALFEDIISLEENLQRPTWKHPSFLLESSTYAYN